jgi:hypothetical protein
MRSATTTAASSRSGTASGSFRRSRSARCRCGVGWAMLGFGIAHGLATLKKQKAVMPPKVQSGRHSRGSEVWRRDVWFVGFWRSEILIAVAVLEHEVDGSEERSGDGADGLILAAPGTNALILSLKIAALLARRCPAALDQGGLEPWSSLAHAGGAPLAGTLIVLGAQPGNLIGSLHFPVTSRLYHLWASSLCALRLTNPACRTLMFRVAPILLSSSSRRPSLS